MRPFFQPPPLLAVVPSVFVLAQELKVRAQRPLRRMRRGVFISSTWLG
jgi:uncharacterized membrane protein